MSETSKPSTQPADSTAPGLTPEEHRENLLKMLLQSAPGFQNLAQPAADAPSTPESTPPQS